jgi:ribosome maturation factor RimP
MYPLLCIVRQGTRTLRGFPAVVCPRVRFEQMPRIAEKVAHEIESILTQAGVELVHVEYLRGHRPPLLRVLIDKDGGVTVDDCQRTSELISPVLDASSLLTTRYVLEVSSPGFDRPLTKEKDFVRFAGQPVKVKTQSAIGGRSVFSGTIEALEGSDVVLEIDGSRVEIPVSEIVSARLDL